MSPSESVTDAVGCPVGTVFTAVSTNCTSSVEPMRSSPRTVTVYGLVSLASESNRPKMTPVSGFIASPAGNPVTV